MKAMQLRLRVCVRGELLLLRGGAWGPCEGWGAHMACEGDGIEGRPGEGRGARAVVGREQGEGGLGCVTLGSDVRLCDAGTCCAVLHTWHLLA